MSNYSMKYPISYGADTFCVVGVATPTASTPTAVQYDKLIMVLICERRGGTILDAECNMVVDVTSDYIASLLIGCNVTRSVSKMTEIEGLGGKRWDKPKKAGKSRDCRGGKF